MSKTLTANFTTEKNKATGAKIRTLLEVDTDGGTKYLSDQALTVSGQPYTANVMAWPNKIRSQIRPGEEVVRTSSARFEINNNPRIDADIRPGLEVRLYLWFEGLATADKLLWFKGIISENIGITAYRVSFTATDIGDWFDKEIGVPLDVATYPNADPDDIGKIQPILYGDLTDQPCLAIVAGAVSTLVNDISAGASSIELSDASAFPSSGTIIIGDEEDITYSGKSSNTLTGVANVSFDYPRSSRVMEKIAQLEYMVASHPVKAITNPRILPFGLKLEDAVRIDSGDFTANISDSGIATVDITEIANVKKTVDVSVTQQQTQEADPDPHLHTSTSVTLVERHATGIIATAFSNTSNAFDFDDTTFASGTAGGAGNLGFTLSFSTTDLGTITEVRIVVKSQRTSAGGQLKASVNWNGSTLVQTHNIAPGLGTRKFVTNITTWSQLARASFNYDPASPFPSTCDCYEIFFEVDYTPDIATTQVNVDEVLPSVVGGNSVADTLGGILIVDCEGTPDDNPAHYTDVADSLIEEPWDIIHHILENYGNGVTDSDINFASFQDAEDNLPASYKFAFSIRQKINMNRLLAMLAQQTWCRFIWEAGSAKLNRIKDSGASTKSIDTDTDSYLSDDRRLQVHKQTRNLSEIYNDIEVKYDLNYTLGSWGTPDAFNGSSEDDNAGSIALYKIRQRTWLMFAIGDNSTMADDVRDKLLEFYKIPRATFTFPSWLKHVELERGDTPDLTTSQIGVSGRICEVIGVDYQPPIPINRQRPELTFELLDLAVILETLSFTMTATINVIDSKHFNTPWCGSADDKLYLQSGQFTSTLKTSESVGGVDTFPAGISYDGTNTPWCGLNTDKLYLTSGQFTSTLKTSEDVGGVDTSPTGISWDGTNTPWCGNQADKLYLQSGQFTSTLKTSEDVGGVDTSPQGISWDGTNTPWCGSDDGKLYLTSGQFTSTIKDSEDVGGVDTSIRGIETNNVRGRLKSIIENLSFTAAATISIEDDTTFNLFNTPWCGSEADKLYLQSGQFTSTLKTSEDVSGVDTSPTGISWDGTNTPWCGSVANKLYLTSGQFTSTLKTSRAIGVVDNNPQGISWDGTNTPWCGSEANKLYLQSGQFTFTLKTSESVGGVDTSPTGISWDGTNTPWCGNVANKLYLTSGQFTSTIKDSEDVGGVDTSPTSIETNDINGRLGI